MQNLRREGGQVQFDIVYGGLAYDPQYHFVPAGVSRGLFSIEDGLLHFKRLPLFPLLERPFFMLAGWYGLYLLPALAGALISGLTWLLAPTKRSGLVSWLFVALASPVWIYASLFWEHTLASFLVLAGCWLVLRQHGAEGTTVSGTATLSWQTGALAGLLMAAGAFLRLEVGIFALAFWGAYAWQYRAHWWPLGLGLGILTLASLLFIPLHRLFLGQSLPENAIYLLRPLAYLRSAGWRAVQDLFIGPFADEAINPGWVGGLWTIAAVLALTRSFDPEETQTTRRWRLSMLAVTVGTAVYFLLTPIPYQSAHGLLFTTPWVLLGLSRIKEVWQQGHALGRLLIRTLLLGLLGYIFGILFLRGSSPHGGLEWGSRFFLTFYPFLALMVAWPSSVGRETSVSSRQQRPLLVITGMLLLLGIGFQLRGLNTIRQDKQFVAAFMTPLQNAADSGSIIVSDLWWLPFYAGDLYSHHPILIFPDEKDTQDWLNFSASARIPQYLLVTLNQNWSSDALEEEPDYPYAFDEMKQVENIWLVWLSREPGS